MGVKPQTVTSLFVWSLPSSVPHFPNIPFPTPRVRVGAKYLQRSNQVAAVSGSSYPSASQILFVSIICFPFPSQTHGTRASVGAEIADKVGVAVICESDLDDSRRSLRPKTRPLDSSSWRTALMVVSMIVDLSSHLPDCL